MTSSASDTARDLITWSMAETDGMPRIKTDTPDTPQPTKLITVFASKSRTSNLGDFCVTLPGFHQLLE
jgi:hypothetical protein